MIYGNRNNSQTEIMRYSKSAIEKDTSTNNIKQAQLLDIYGEIYKYFASVWKRFLTLLKEASKNWKMVREYILIGTSAVLIMIFCVFNLMYK